MVSEVPQNNETLTPSKIVKDVKAFFLRNKLRSSQIAANTSKKIVLENFSQIKKNSSVPNV